MIDRKLGVYHGKKARAQIRRWQKALDDNDGFTILVEVPDEAAKEAMEKLIKAALDKLDARISIQIVPAKL